MEEKRTHGPGRRCTDCHISADYCLEHSGLEAKISALQTVTKDLKGTIDKVFSRTNVILGGVCISCILLAINILIKTKGGS